MILVEMDDPCSIAGELANVRSLGEMRYGTSY